MGRTVRGGGGLRSLLYAVKKGQKVGYVRLWKALQTKNACKTCAFGMGGQLGGMRNEAGHFPEVCKKSIQAMAADMQGRIEPEFFETYTLRQMAELTPRELEAMGRLADPLIKGPGEDRYRPIAWEEAFTVIARSMSRTDPQRAFLYASGRSSNEAGFLLNLLARAYGTNHLTNCSYYCHQASGVGLMASVGTPTATVELDDLDRCDTVFLIGGNPASNHPRLMTKLMQVRERGGKVVVVNPLKEAGLQSFRVPSNFKSMLLGSEIASHYVQPPIGGDIALFAGIAKFLIERNVIDRAFIETSTEGYDALERYTRSLSWDDIEQTCSVPRERMEEIADVYAKSKGTIFAWTMGITHHEHGVQNVRWIANLALLRGMVGREGAGLLPIRGHSNVQGMGTVGVSPKVRQAVLERLEEMGLKPPTFAGFDTLGTLEAAARGEMDFGLCLGGNLYGASPDSEFVKRALGRLDTLVYLSTTLNTGHVHGLAQTTIVLPVLARDEESQSTTQESMFNYIRLSDGGPRRIEGPQSETEVLSEIGHRVLGSAGVLDWQALKSHSEIRRLIGRLVPGLEQAGTIGETRKEFQIPGRVLHQPRFNTSSRKASFAIDPIPARVKLDENEFRLMTIRSEGQFNTVVYEEEDIYRGQQRRDVILMNPRDMLRIGLKENDPVRVASETGAMDRVLVREFDIADRCAAMYYPEANVLVPRTVDPLSKTPAYKSVMVTVRPSSDGGESALLEAMAKPNASSRHSMR